MDNIKQANLYIIGIPEGKEKGIENVFEQIMAENFLDTRCTESPKQDEPKQSNTKTYYDKNGKS